jgi:hypothetical protein
MYETKDTFEDLPILIELRSSLSRAYAAGDFRRPGAPAQRPGPRTRGRVTVGRYRPRRIALAGAVVAVVLAVAGVLGFQGSGFTPSPALAATMDQLAQIAANQDWGGIPAPGQYLYTKSESIQITDSGTVRLDHRLAWFDSNGRIRVWDPENMRDGTVDTIGGPDTYFPTTVSGWKALSTDPSTLLQQIHQLDAPSADATPAEEFTNIGDALREIPIPPASRALLYQAVALIPGVQLMGPQTNPTGQSGLGVGYYQDGKLQSELIFDQQTARLLGERTYDQAGKLTFAESYLQQAIVNNAPTAGSTPPATKFPALQADASQSQPTAPAQSTTTS